MLRLILFLMLSGTFAFGQRLKLNEIHYGQSELISNQFPLNSFFLEFYNESTKDVRLGKYALKCESRPNLKALPDSLAGAWEFVGVTVEDLSITLGRKLQLVNLDTNEVEDEVEIVELLTNQSLGRVPDGSGDWHKLVERTPGESNSRDYDTELDRFDKWYKYTHNGSFGFRDGAGSIVFKDEMWLLGGWAHGPLLSDIWKSKNGTDWEFVTTAPWPGRHNAGMVVFNDKIWVLSGDLHPDIWTSDDGVNWDLITDDAPWGKRYAPYVVVFDDKIWLMGGQSWEELPSGEYNFGKPVSYNDVWSTRDGKHWELVTENAPWEPRSMIQGSIVLNERMYIIGGGIKEERTTVNEYNDVWSSRNGIDWRLELDSAPWSPRIHFSVIVYNNKMWLTDGSPGQPWVLTNEVWFSEDGVNWEELRLSFLWAPRHATSLFNFNGSLWVVAGFNGNDAWKFTDSPMVYYSKPTGDPADLHTWGRNKDGSGKRPPSFELENQLFILTNRDSAIVERSIPRLGPRSRLILGDGESAMKCVFRDVPEIRADVSAKTSVHFYNPKVVSFGRMYPETKISISASDTARISSGAYHDLILDGRHIELGGSSPVWGGLRVTKNSSVSLPGRWGAFGDVSIEAGARILQGSMSFAGYGRQSLTAAENLSLDMLAVNKQDGTLEMSVSKCDVGELFLSKGEIKLLKGELSAKRLVSSFASGFISLAPETRLSVSVDSEAELVVPIAYDSIRVPLLLRTSDPSSVSLSVKEIAEEDSVDLINIERVLRIGWIIESDNPLQVAFMWNNLVEPIEFDYDNLVIVHRDQREISDAEKWERDAYPDLNTTLASVVNGGLILIGDKKLIPDIEVILPDTVFYADTFFIHASASSGLPVSLTSADTARFVLHGDTIYVADVGVMQLRASVQGNREYVSREIELDIPVYPAKQQIFFSFPDEIEFSGESIPLEGMASSGLPLVFEVDDERLIQVDGDQLLTKGIGVAHFRIIQPGSDHYSPAEQSKSIRIKEPSSADGFMLVFSIFPNPGSGRINVTVDRWPYNRLEIEILDMSGRSVFHHASDYVDFRDQVDLEGLRTGTYLVRLKGGNRVFQRKLVVVQ